MEQKTYKYKDTELKLKPLTLSVLSVAAPLLVKLRKLQNENTEGIDISALEKAKRNIKDMETAISQLQDKDKSEDLEKQIDELNTRITNAKQELETDAGLLSTQKLYNECTSLAFIELLGEQKLIENLIGLCLEATENEKMNAVELAGDADAIGIVKEIVTDFFICIAASMKKLKS